MKAAQEDTVYQVQKRKGIITERKQVHDTSLLTSCVLSPPVNPTAAHHPPPPACHHTGKGAER